MLNKSIQAVFNKYRKEWMGIVGVVGVGIGDHEKKTCIKILVKEETEHITEKIPAEVDGCPIFIEKVDEIEVLQSAIPNNV